MTIVSQTVGADVAAQYDGYNSQEVGLGLQTGMYATPQYARKKIQNLVLGGLSRITYAGWDTDRSPVILTLKFEPSYQTVLGLNIRYMPERLRRALLKYVLDTNAARIQSNQPMLIDYNSLKRSVPNIAGIVRRYKVLGVRVDETIPLVEWPNVVKEKSPHESVYRQVNG